MPQSLQAQENCMHMHNGLPFCTPEGGLGEAPWSQYDQPKSSLGYPPGLGYFTNSKKEIINISMKPQPSSSRGSFPASRPVTCTTVIKHSDSPCLEQCGNLSLHSLRMTALTHRNTVES